MTGLLSAAASADAGAAGSDAPPLPLFHSLLGGRYATSVTGRYRVTGLVLGSGAFATTRLCVDRATGAHAACKSIPKRRLLGLSKDWTDVRKEVQVMHHLSGARRAGGGRRAAGAGILSGRRARRLGRGRVQRPCPCFPASPAQPNLTPPRAASPHPHPAPPRRAPQHGHAAGHV
jgi:hypothetical protein